MGRDYVRHPVLHLLLRYTQALITRMSKTAVCNRHHSLDQLKGPLNCSATAIIRYVRGHITILDRAGFEKRSREGYLVVKKEYGRLLPHPPIVKMNVGVIEPPTCVSRR